MPSAAAEPRRQAEEAALSRVYGAIHFPVDSSAGLELGRRVGETALGAWGV